MSSYAPLESFSPTIATTQRPRSRAVALSFGVAAVALLVLLTGSSGSNRPTRQSLAFRQSLSSSASSEDNNGGTDGTHKNTGGASDFIDTADLGDYVDAIIGPAPSGLTDGGFKKRGSLAVSKIDASGFYYLNIEGEAGHALKCILQGSDGYHRHWKGYGQIYTGPVHEGNYGGKDYLQIQDLVTGEVEYFRFRFT
ncbi:hypothetical protein T484DRAFT_1751793 [Baffinella frigidus]|nr:hypothetical protein T484DRAFT_1751793 [Cryptophyta sp. CCMP2293]